MKVAIRASWKTPSVIAVLFLAIAVWSLTAGVALVQSGLIFLMAVVWSVIAYVNFRRSLKNDGAD